VAQLKPGENYDYVVIGNPVAHSRSPEIHALFAAQSNDVVSYGRLRADDFSTSADEFFHNGGLGANVTVPFKGDAAAWVDELDESARFARAVNTIVRVAAGGAPAAARFRGHNTDGDGLIADLRRALGESLRDARVLILGAGGAVRGILAPLAAQLPAAITIANRTEQKAVALVAALREEFPDCAADARAFAALTPGYDLVINGTSAGLSGTHVEIAAAVLQDAFCYDMSYGAASAFCRFAQEAGAAGQVDGLGMLVEQAALAFLLWRGTMPDTRPVIEQLRMAEPLG